MNNTFAALDTDSESDDVEIRTKQKDTVNSMTAFASMSGEASSSTTKRMQRQARNKIKKMVFVVPLRYVGKFIGKKHTSRLALLDDIARETQCKKWSLKTTSTRGEFLFVAARNATSDAILIAQSMVQTSIDELTISTTKQTSLYAVSETSEASTVAFEPLSSSKKKSKKSKKFRKGAKKKKKKVFLTPFTFALSDHEFPALL